METTTWALILYFLGANNQPIAMTSIQNIPSGFDCTEAGRLWLARGPGKKGFQCLPIGSEQEPRDAAK